MVKKEKREDEKAVLKVSAVTSGYFRGSEYKVLDKDLEIKNMFTHTRETYCLVELILENWLGQLA